MSVQTAIVAVRGEGNARLALHLWKCNEKVEEADVDAKVDDDVVDDVVEGLWW